METFIVLFEEYYLDFEKERFIKLIKAYPSTRWIEDYKTMAFAIEHSDSELEHFYAEGANHHHEGGNNYTREIEVPCHKVDVKDLNDLVGIVNLVGSITLENYDDESHIMLI
jgi:hypothetical protein